jgi:tRNA dimethylallyltransferase
MIIITGQTATGKTKLAFDFAKKYNGEVVNFDSRQIYKKLDIITGKDIDKKKDQFFLWKKVQDFEIGYYLKDGIKLWLYDIVLPNQYFSSFNFVSLAADFIAEIRKQKKTPILVGGSYFYLKHLLYGFDYPVPPNFSLRKKLEDLPVKKLQEILKKHKNDFFQDLNESDRKNKRRLIRKIEIAQYLLKHKIDVQKKERAAPLFPVKKFIGLRFSDKNLLRKKIEERVKKRLKMGALSEVFNLLKEGYQPSDCGLKTIGYKQLIPVVLKKKDLNEAISLWIKAEVSYAKRQYTFMKKDKNIEWKEIN